MFLQHALYIYLCIYRMQRFAFDKLLKRLDAQSRLAVIHRRSVLARQRDLTQSAGRRRAEVDQDNLGSSVHNLVVPRSEAVRSRSYCCTSFF